MSLAIGKQGLKRHGSQISLADWNIDVKTEEQFEEMDLNLDSQKAVSDLFNTSDDEEITNIAELPDIPQRVVDILAEMKLN